MTQYYNDLNTINSQAIYNQLPEYTRIAKYAQYNQKEQRRETWEEQVDRVFKMHKVKFASVSSNPKFLEYVQFAKNSMTKKHVLGSQRALQFGGPSILKKNTRMYNCAATYVDRCRVFQEIMFTLLCGVGMGFSVQVHHIAKLPTLHQLNTTQKIYVIEDSIEGWADSIGVLVNSYFTTTELFQEYNKCQIVFDFSKIRPKGSHISHIGGNAPGSDGLRLTLQKIKDILENCVKMGFTKLRPIDAYDIIVHSSDAVLSGGIRRAATICIFSLEDEEMIQAKTGDWYIKNAQRARSNNSVMLIRDEIKKDHYMNLIESVKQFGEPGLIFSSNKETLFNPCVEISLYAYDKNGQSGIQMCNLCEMNMSNVVDEVDFYERCKAASILGTLQAAYTDFGYLGDITKNIVEKEALLGVSMTGMMDNPLISFNPVFLEKGASIIKEINKEMAEMIGINQAARTTCIKPAGTTSCILGTSSGIHPCYSERFFRLVQSNSTETPLHFFKQYNKQAVEQSVWSAGKTDDVITFLCKSKPGAITRDNVTALELLEKVKLVQKYWVQAGKNPHLCVQPWLTHNVSNTITIKETEWEKTAEYIYENREFFTGISMLAETGDMAYNQAPFQAVYTHKQITDLYGTGSLFSSGLIVHAIQSFGSLYTACSSFLGNGEKLQLPNFEDESLQSLTDSDKIYSKLRWIAQATKFSNRHFNGDKLKLTYCLKSIHNWKKWCDLKRTYKNVPWENFTEVCDNTTPTQYIACSGQSCEMITF